MNINIYKSLKSPKYLFVPVDTNVSNLVLEDEDLKVVTLYRQGYKIEPGKPLIGLDTKAALEAIESDGYYVQQINIKFTLS